jgi:hypothetical protein
MLLFRSYANCDASTWNGAGVAPDDVDKGDEVTADMLLKPVLFQPRQPPTLSVP